MKPAGNKKTFHLIEIPPNPYFGFGMRLGRDELTAWLISTGATFAASGLLHFFGRDIPLATHALILAVVGPIMEKPGIFFHYFKDAFREYRAAESAGRKSPRRYVGKALRAGWPSLRADLLYHDPIYVVLLWLLLLVTGAQSVIGATLLAAASFITALAIATVLDVLWVDFTYRRLHRRLCRVGFVTKSYYETRFLVDPEGDEKFSPEKVLNRLQAHFFLPVRSSCSYRDVYITRHSLSVYNERKPYLRFRRRVAEDGSVTKQAVQVMYTRAREVRGARDNLYRCFSALKQKSGFDFAQDADMPWSAKEISDPRVRREVERLASVGARREVRFKRHIAMDPKGVFISVDIPPAPPAIGGAYWIEVKIKDDITRLQEVSDYIAWKLPVRATTRTKIDAL
jgi:hypothetical protein